MIRAASSADARGIAEVQVRTWKTSYKHVVPDAHLDAMVVDDAKVERIRSWFEPSGDKQTFVAVDRARIVGFAGGGPQRDAELPFAGELYAIYVFPELQRSGYGRRLIRALAEHLHARGLNSMSVWVLERGPARGFYERLGGRLLDKRIEREFSGTRLPEVAYGWVDTGALRTTP